MISEIIRDDALPIAKKADNAEQFAKGGGTLDQLKIPRAHLEGMEDVNQEDHGNVGGEATSTRLPGDRQMPKKGK